MAKKKKQDESAVEQTGAIEQTEAMPGRFVDVVVEGRRVRVKLSDQRRLEIAEEACGKHREAAKLQEEIKAFADARKDLIKGFKKEAADLDEQFFLGTEMLDKEVRIVKDFANGRLRVEVIESGEVVEDREFSPNECQRDFSNMLDADPSDNLLQRALDIIRMEGEMATGGVAAVENLPGVIAEKLGVSVSFAARLIETLKWTDVLWGTGTEDDPLVICDPHRACSHCLHEEEKEDRAECEDCQYEDDLPNFEPADKCGGCRFMRQQRTFVPCKHCRPNDTAEGFAALPME